MRFVRLLIAGVIVGTMLAACGDPDEVESSKATERSVAAVETLDVVEPLPFNHHGLFAGSTGLELGAGEPGE